MSQARNASIGVLPATQTPGIKTFRGGPPGPPGGTYVVVCLRGPKSPVLSFPVGDRGAQFREKGIVGVSSFMVFFRGIIKVGHVGGPATFTSCFVRPGPQYRGGAGGFFFFLGVGGGHRRGPFLCVAGCRAGARGAQVVIFLGVP